MRHHDETIAAFVAEQESRDGVLAVILAGSVARGVERADSDVDAYVVVDDDAFAAASTAERLSYIEEAVATYPGGYVDIKLATLAYLEAAAADGDDPVRASFAGARVTWVRDAALRPDLDALIAAIPSVDAAGWASRVDSFIAQSRLYGGYFLPQGLQLGDEFLTRFAALHLVSSASRALLAHHHVLFSGPKYLSGLVAELPSLPDDYLALSQQLLVAPDADTAREFMAALEAFAPWPLPRENTLSLFVRDNELAWLTRTPPPEFR